MPPFDLQGHRGARGLRPENTLPSFEAAFDAGASSVETDLHLTRDGVAVLCHDPCLSEPAFAPVGPGLPPLSRRPAVRTLSLEELRGYRAAGNPDAARFPDQRPEVGPLARLFGAEAGLDPFAVPTLADLFAFTAAYAGAAGRRAGKTDAQRQGAARVRFDLELKRVPFRPDGSAVALEERLLEAVAVAGVVGRTGVRSFDHRCVGALCRREPRLTGGVLVAHTAPVAPGEWVRQAGAQVYCPEYEFVDADLVRAARAGGSRVVPWTVNEPEDWGRLLAWGVDGITTDYPDRLAGFLRARGVAF
jgi:glycerophosphoryl diester phosphodiesterase